MKVAIISRGVSGSGKSTFNKVLEFKAKRHKQSVVVHSTDELFMVDGEYKFDFKSLGYNHKINYNNFMESLSKGTSIVICDNTNCKSRDYKFYALSAENKGYTVISVFFHPSELSDHMKRNSHGVPIETLDRQKKNLLNNIETKYVNDSFYIKPDNFFEDIEKVSQAIIGKNIF